MNNSSDSRIFPRRRIKILHKCHSERRKEVKPAYVKAFRLRYGYGETRGVTSYLLGNVNARGIMMALRSLKEGDCRALRARNDKPGGNGKEITH